MKQKKNKKTKQKIKFETKKTMKHFKRCIENNDRTNHITEDVNNKDEKEVIINNNSHYIKVMNSTIHQNLSKKLPCHFTKSI